ncbi:hypothetical protein [Mesorhizobium sp.]|uniref:hypothetical protein n=1 Tax=Mesorhizobium sp. TaxID=1871066 RepID=UPI00263A3083|nr:hypothetical protein [Mesorhizobium sp.]
MRDNHETVVHFEPSRGTPKLPHIRIKPEAYGDLAEEVEKAIMLADLPVFRRGNRLVFPVVRQVEGAGGVLTAAAQLAEIGPEWMRQIMERAAAFERYNKRERKWLPVQPPLDIANLMLVRVADWEFPEVAGVMTTPTLNPAGKLVAEEGYDPATRLYFADLPIMPAMPAEPSRDDALRALADLEQLLSEFIFIDDASRSVALSGLITPVCRGAIPLAPMHVADAPEPGTGKSFLWDIASVIATGRPCPVIAATRKTDEMEKRLGAALLKGQQVISLDNINGVLKSDQLCQILERPRVEVRILGSSKSPDIESRTTWFATGNNLRVVADLNRRTLTARLDANLERPEFRTFQHDPIAAVMRERGRYIAACLTIVRAYVCAGMPGRLPPLASFRAWSDMIRSSLVWLGCADPCDTIQMMRDNDPELAQRRAVFDAWPAYDVPYSVADLVKLCDPEGDYGKLNEGEALRAALMDIAPGPKGSPDPSALGNWLRDNKDRTLNKKKLVREPGGTRTKAALWSMRQLPGAS